MVKVYEPEFKKQIAQLHLQGESISSISKQYGVSKASINAWTKKYREECSDKNSNAEYSLNKEIAQIDFTYLPTIQGIKQYNCTIIDLYNRCVVASITSDALLHS